MTSKSTTKTRNAISNEKKAALRAQRQLKPYLNYKSLAQWFEETYKQRIDISSVARIVSPRYASLDSISSEAVQKQAKRRAEHWPELEKAIFEWVQRAEQHITISQEAIRVKAKEYWEAIYPEKSMPAFSNGWLTGFQNRANIKYRIQHGEAGSLANEAESAMAKIRQATRSFAPQDIFNCDESALFWKMTPDRSLSTRSVPGRKKQKARISILFCCNSDGSERLPLLIIGTAKRPRSFAAAGININNLNCTWRSNTKAWMTGEIFKEWLIQFNNRMKNRRVVLLMDNFSAHESAAKEIESQLENILILWLPPNSTTKYQPLDQGIINNWKVIWKKNWILYMVKEYDRGFDPLTTMTVLQGIRWAIEAWSVDVKVDTIRNCFNKALHCEKEEEFKDIESISLLESSFRSLQLSNRIQNIMDIKEFLNPEGEEISDSLMDIDSAVLSQFSKPQEIDDDEDAEISDTTPLVPIQSAFECLRILRLYEEQQQQADPLLLQYLIPYERLLTRRKIDSQHQRDIRDFFGAAS